MTGHGSLDGPLFVHLCGVEPCGECGALPGVCCPHCDDWQPGETGCVTPAPADEVRLCDEPCDHCRPDILHHCGMPIGHDGWHGHGDDLW